MLNILHTVPALDGGGADRILYDYTVRMTDSFHFDFIVHTETQGMLEADLRAKGCNIYHVPALHSDRKRHISAVRKIIKDGRYDIVHVSQGYKGFLFLLFAKMYGVKVRIAHSHMAYIPETIPVYLVRKCTAFLSKLFATHLFACGKDAAVWMWGKRAYNSGKVHIRRIMSS